MRQDMKKVLTERPRHGHDWSYHEVRSREFRGDYDNLPAFQGMRAPYVRNWGGKDFTDHISPLIRFLWSCVGRSWNDVWSEICKAVPSNNTVDAHLKDHVLREIDIHTFLDEEGEIGVADRYGRRKKPRGLYVDPRDGIIRAGANDEHNARSTRKWSEDHIRVDDHSYLAGEGSILYPVTRRRQGKISHVEIAFNAMKLLDDGKAVLINGIWYKFSYKKCKEPRIIDDIINGETVSRKVTFPEFDQLYGHTVHTGVYHTNKKQLSTNELKRFGLRNTKIA